MAPRSQKLALVLVALAGLASTLEVAPGSSCATFCLDDGETDAFDSAASSTNSSDITCRDIDFSTKDKGIKYKSCLECLSKSKRVYEEESDVHWYIYNLRYALSTCLFSSPGSSSNSQVDSPCVIDHACRPLEDPLTEDNLDANSTDTYGYCDASEGIFTGKPLSSCISCLQASNEQSYLSNFMIALQAGCEQKPDSGSLLSLTGTVFTTNAINITEPPVDITSQPSGAGSATLTTGAIVGIAVGVGLFLLGGIALFIMYWRKQKRLERNEKADAFRRGSGGGGSFAATPDPILPPGGNEMTASLRSYTPQQGGGGGYHSKGPSMTSGDYYDKLEEEIAGPRLNYNFDPRSKSRGPNTALPSHEAYIPRAVSRLKSNESIGSSQRTASPPRGHARSQTMGSTMPLQVVLNSSGSFSESTNTNTPPLPTIQQPPASRRAASVDHGSGMPPPPPPGPPPRAHSKTPSISMPSIRKMRRPKQYAPPKLETEASEMQISQPVMSSESRFQDRPLQGGTVFSTEGQALENRADGKYEEIPMRSGKSTLYGY